MYSGSLLIDVPFLTPLYWMGTSLKELRACPGEVKDGIATPKQEIDLIKRRLRDAVEHGMAGRS